MKANLATSLIAYARGGVRKQLLVLCLLTLCVGNMWADEITVYVTGEIFIGTGEDAWDNATSTIKVDVRKGHPECFDCDGFNGLYNQDMTNTGYTYNGYPIYSYTLNQAGAQFRFKHYKSGAFQKNYTTDWHSTTNQIYQGYYSDAHHWITYGRDVTFYATPEKMDGSKWKEGTHSLFANFKYGDGESEWKRQQMTKTAYTYNGDAIYTCTMLLPYNVIKNVQFLYNDGSDHDLYVYTPSPQLTANDVDGKILLGWNGSHNWVSYGRDVTIYTIPDYLFKDIETPYDESIHYPAVCIQMGTGSTWNTVNMTKTSYTYATYPIYKATILIDQNKFWEYQIKYFKKSDNTQVDLYQFNQFEPKTEYAPSYIDDKLYHGWNGSSHSHDFFPYTYDVKLDQQGGSGGTESIKATDGANLPDATMPGRDGYIFGGYYTEVGGSGDQYYDTIGNSSTQWNSRTITTLYAKWTARNYIVNLEDPPTTTPVTVTFDATLSSITPPTKMYYTFDGYWTDNDDTGATLDKQLIDKDGNWKKSISPYTGTSGDSATWIYPNGKSLFAKWDEDLHDVTIAVYPADAGVVQVSGETISSVSNVGYATHSPVLTAVPSNAAWVFKEWQVTSNAHLDLEHYSTTGTTMKITATDDDQILTAVFEPRYGLIGSLNEEGDPDGGMPNKNGETWGVERSADYEADFEVIGFTALGAGDGTGVDLQCTRTLLANRQYKFQVVDRSTIGRDRFCLAENGSAVLEPGNSVTLTYKEKGNANVLLNAEGEGDYTFKITNISNDGNYYPTLTVIRPQQVNFGQKYQDIDGALHTDTTTTGGSATATAGGNALTSGDYVTYNTSVTHTATSAGGYTFAGWWSSDAFEGDAFSSTNPMTYAVTSGDNAYAKFVETSTSVTLANDGHGKVQIGGVDQTRTTCGVTTTRELTAVPNEGYKFSSWSKSGDDITLSSTSTNLTTLSGNGSGATSGQTVTANFEERYSIKGTMNGENWGTTHTLSNIGTNAGSKDTCYVTMTLPANTTYEFAIYDEQTKGWLKNSTTEVFKMTYGNSSAWPFDTDKTVNCGITTAGRGTYKFIFNITDKTVTVVYPTSYQVNYGAAVGGSVTSVLDDDGKEIPNGGYVREDGSVTYEATANDGYTFTGWCPDDSYGDTFTNYNPWENSNITAPSNAYAKFHSTNFVIYRKDDKASDPRIVWDDVESYEGGTISETIEFRMKVNKLDYWYTLCLPFEVNAVQVWEDGAYYDIVPYWRTDSTYYTGHYILRKPVTTTNFAIEGFEGKDRWIDPESSDVLPSKNIPYIIQWHDEYFQGKYISFFGTAGQTIPIAMDKGSYASSDETVNIYGNNSMTTGMVRDAYLLDPYYGTNGAWMREELGTDRSVLPFECFILANPATTAKYRVLRRDMADDTPTGLDTLSKTEDTVSKVLIDNHIYIIRGGKIYTIQGTFVKEVE